MQPLMKQISIAIATAAVITLSLFAVTVGLTRSGVGGHQPQSQPHDRVDPEALALSSPQNIRLERAPDFRVTDIHGRTLSLGSLQGKVAIIDFWATWCPPCRMEIPILNNLQEKYRRQGLEIVGISLDNHTEEIRAFLEHTPLKYRVALGDEMVVSQFGGIAALPTVFFLDRKGNIRTKHIGLTSQSTFEPEVRQLLTE